MSDDKATANVHLLLVEDNPGYLQELIEWLKIFGYQHIDTASSAAEAREKLQQPFDVIVADMRMEQDDSGFAIVEEVKQRDLCSVVIILTANDTVADCRKAFKLGAWDYISKNMQGNVFEVAHQSIQEAIAYFNRWGNVQNEQWIDENMDRLQQEYQGRYIAVINKSVIESADTREALENRINERKLRRFLTTIRKIGDLRPIAELVTLPESPTLEFKSSLQWDVRQQCKNKDLRFSVLRTIVAFLNCEGGTLLIGVQDDGSIFGLEADLALLSKNSLDQFEQTLVNHIREHVGLSFIPLIKVRFESLSGKDV
ncbi:MAG: response regulator [Chloroflexaceae bacterium]